MSTPIHSTIITDPYALASAGLVHYSGDIRPLSYGGAWIDTSTWTRDGYASCVRVMVLDDGPCDARHIIIEKLTINEPNDLGPALRCCGLDEAGPTGHELPPLALAECCLAYGHYEHDSSDWRYQFVILDDGQEPRDFASYCRIHDASIVTKADVWIILNQIVGCDLYCGPTIPSTASAV